MVMLRGYSPTLYLEKSDDSLDKTRLSTLNVYI